MLDYAREQEERDRVELEESAMRARGLDPGKHHERNKPDDIVANAADWYTPLGILQINAFRELHDLYKKQGDRTPEMMLAEAITKTSDDNLGEALRDRPELIKKWLN